MSIEAARRLYVDMLNDSALAARVENCASRAERLALLRRLGYHFSFEEWQSVLQEVKDLLVEDGELDGPALERVVGGAGTSWLADLSPQEKERLSTGHPPSL
jgi:predicted ribosomally synthesized peptide with nif11-like leader